MSLVLVFGLAIAGYFSWEALFSAVLFRGESIFLIPFLWFSCAIILFILVSVFAKEIWLQAASIVLTFGSSLFFAWGVWHSLFLLCGSTLAYLAMHRIQIEMGERLRFSFRKNVTPGLAFLILGLSLAISSQYYVHAQQLTWEKLVPNFDLGEGSGQWMLRTLGTVYPPLRSLQDEEVTVDTFFRNLQQQQKPEDSLPGISPEVAIALEEHGVRLEDLANNTALQEAVAESQRENFSRLLGRPVDGDEKMGAVISEVLRKKTLTFINDTSGNQKLPIPVIPFVLAVLLFLSVYPLGAIFSPIWRSIASLIFFALVRARLVRIEKIPVEQERLV